MDDDARMTGTYQMLVATGSGLSRIEARARRLASKAKDVGNWRLYLDLAELELLGEALNPNPDPQ